ncbi:sulfite exporter TauE/SafE family protein [Alginatibacterium sediminis]|uniref:Probable membrane transporter protein n=1 Tax=Alginatibacterium sediminis TaxID=2164068 RepID=A0A420EDV8_9ALTE|nr:sulfite exporter TauE/SafE family protein [Alginatibacterium sediminis]RKF18853.1 sulfite exporter TauE/SafE family protein [Alginatibacterium sediminis]
MDFSLLNIAILLVLGAIAGVINVLAGGGSNLTLPALMLMGLPADVANASNRVGVFFQALVGVRGFQKHNKLETTEIVPILIPTLVGGVVGAVLASFLPEQWLKPLLLLTMLGMTFLMIIKPSAIVVESGTVAKKVSQSSMGWWSLFFAGIYGGFVQAGVGFVLIAALAGSLNYDLVRANALKLVCTLAFTSVALLVFIWQSQVNWSAGIILGIGAMAGAQVGVKLALNISPQHLKWFLFWMTLFGVIAALTY